MKVKEILSAHNKPNDCWDVVEVDGDLPINLYDFADALNNPRMNREGPWADDTWPNSEEADIVGDYSIITFGFEEYNRLCNFGCCPEELRETFPRTIIAVKPQGRSARESI